MGVLLLRIRINSRENEIYNTLSNVCKRVKVKQSLYRPGVAQRVPGS
jgi:hypothetical protein